MVKESGQFRVRTVFLFDPVMVLVLHRSSIFFFFFWLQAYQKKPDKHTEKYTVH